MRHGNPQVRDSAQLLNPKLLNPKIAKELCGGGKNKAIITSLDCRN